jgi:hypothetical protein
MPRKRVSKLCFDRILVGQQALDAAALAVKENPANVPIFAMPPGVMATPEPLALAAVTAKLWKPGRTLRVRFLEGNPTVQAKVEQVAHNWEQYANIKFAFGTDPDAEIRISFTHDPGSWSYLGTDALTIPKSQPTMNYGWLQLNTPDQEYHRVVQHEFGHALSCIHEHQSPGAEIPWDKEAVYRRFMGPPNNWSRAQVDANLFQRYSATTTQFTTFDTKSIMLYAIPNDLTIGDWEVGWNTEISDTDKTFIGTLYPMQMKDYMDLTVGGQPAEAGIGQHGEEDLFRFDVSAAGTYTVETGGKTDVVMGLYGPDDRTKQLGFDDDSGKGLNAKISKSLQPGAYYLRIRHFRPRGTGTYTVNVRAGA